MKAEKECSKTSFPQYVTASENLGIFSLSKGKAIEVLFSLKARESALRSCVCVREKNDLESTQPLEKFTILAF